MPSRIIKETICSSDSIKGLSWFEEVVFYRLIVNADDYGRLDGRIDLLLSALFRVRRDITEAQLNKALNALTTEGMVCRYEVNGKPFLQLNTWSKHNKSRAKESKFPPPPQIEDDAGTCEQMKTNVSTCEQMSPYSYSYSNSYSLSCTEQTCFVPEPPPVITLTLNDKTEYPIFKEQTDKWAGLYPAVDVIQQLRNMKGWLDGNPGKRKTKSGILRFVTSWLAKEQNRGGSFNVSPATDYEGVERL